jgi:hypothetical protein
MNILPEGNLIEKLIHIGSSGTKSYYWARKGSQRFTKVLGMPEIYAGTKSIKNI